MKGIHFLKPLEWQIEAEGESWQQGDRIRGHLHVLNHGQENISLKGLGVDLAYGEFKSIEKKEDDCFTGLQSANYSDETILNSKKKETTSFDFLLPENAAITDKKGSFFLRYGGAHLELKIVPWNMFSTILELIERFQRFKMKEQKTIKGGIEIKLTPPPSRDYAKVDMLHLGMSRQQETIKLKFSFKTKKLDMASAAGTGIVKEKNDFEIILAPESYLMSKGIPDQDKILKAIDEVFSQVKVKGFMS